MALFTLTPPPPNLDADSKNWRDWIQALYTALKGVSFLKFSQLDFSGSNLTSIETRNHNDLQNIQGGAPGDEQHLTSAQVAQFQNSLLNAYYWAAAYG